MIDFSKITAPTARVSAIDPIELFRQLKVTDSSINDLWLAQGDALREWHENRSDADIGIVLNTGAGKTLVGLLAAQSLVNETKGRVLYACSSIQLVEQTAEKAAGYGLKVTTYFRGGYSNDLFSRCLAPCVTTYQALFNGLSVFFREDVAAVVFDDAHAAEHLLRDHFSVRISQHGDENLYGEVVSLFEDYFRNTGKSVSLRETREGKSAQVLLVPPFEVRNQHQELTSRLLDGGVQKWTDTKFSWEHVKDRVDQCCVLISGSDVTLTPPFVPTLTLRYFSNSVRRVYLSATLSAPDAFTRTFGKVPDRVVAPATTAGECERLIAIPSRVDSASDGVSYAKRLIAERKALVLVPNYSRAREWEDLVEPPPREQVTDHVAVFKNGTGREKLLLAARYDGVDLPGDTCRLMVIDDLPLGVGRLERYLWESLGMNNSLRSTIASRIVQSFGRISRGMSDHGVVILTGKRLLDWIMIPRNAAILPEFLQKQLALGDRLSDDFGELKDMQEAIDACLERDEGWRASYERFMQDARAEVTVRDTENLLDLAEAEAECARLMWRRDFEGAARTLAGTLEKAYGLSSGTGAWHSLWLGFAQEMLGDIESATDLYVRAHSNEANIPPVRRNYDAAAKSEPGSQVSRIRSQVRIWADGNVSLPKTLAPDLNHLSGAGSAAQTEEALRCLGQYLGLVSTRPEKEHGAGPDVLWLGKNGPALCIEAKTDKKASSLYLKEDIGQMANHVQWVRDQHGASAVIPLFVGPVNGSSEAANPPEDFRVAALESFESLGQRLVAALEDATCNALNITLGPQLSDALDQRGLNYPDLLGLLNLRALREL